MTLNFDIGFNTNGGGSGSGDATYVHDQAVASDSWTIQHNLKKWPSIEVVNSANVVVEGQYTYIDLNTMQANFNGKFKGKAYIN